MSDRIKDWRDALEFLKARADEDYEYVLPTNQECIDVVVTEVERLRAELAEKDAAIAQAYEDGRISACNAGKPGCPRAAASEAELAAVRALMDTYNVGGWTDAIEPMKRALAAEAACAQMREALTGAVQALRTVGDDYPGSSCHEWCHKQADAYAAALATDAGKGWVSTDDAICTAVVADDGYVIAVLSEALAGSEVYIIRKGKP